MFIVNSYPLAVALCFVTMLCWGSWGNTQKMVAGTWRQELYYWDYVIGVLLMSVILGFTLGSFGEGGRSFLNDLSQISLANVLNAFAGGVIFNASNLLLTAAIVIVGLSVAFPLGVGIGLVLGVIVNFIENPKGNALILFLGVGMITAAIVLDGVAAQKMGRQKQQKSVKGIVLCILAGILISFFYRFVAAAMDLNHFEAPTPGMATPYSAFFIFAMGMFVSNLALNTWVMKKPFAGSPVSYADYFCGSFRTHLVGIFGGLVWGLGTGLSYLAAGKAGAPVSYALGQGATMVAALWGLLIWKEFKGAPRSVNVMLALMVILFVSGIAAIIVAGNS